MFYTLAWMLPSCASTLSAGKYCYMLMHGMVLRTNDWTKIHAFPSHVKCDRFCIRLGDEARLWYESLYMAHSRISISNLENFHF